MKPIYARQMNRKYMLLNLILIAILLSGFKLNAQDNTLSLSDALELALSKNYGITISKSKVDIASINNSWGTAGRYPNIGFSVVSANNQELIENTRFNRVTAGIGLNWTIFNGFRVNITKDKLEKLESIAKGRSAIVVENTIQDIILSYYNILLQKERLKVLETLMSISKDRYDYEQTRFEIGGSVTSNVLLAKNSYLDDKASHINQQVVVRNAIRNLNFLMGETPSKTWLLAEKFNSDTLDYVFGDLMEKMMASNSTLQNQYANLLIQQNEIDLKRTALYPRVSLSAGIDNAYSWTKPEGQATISGESLTPYGNVSLSYDLFTGGNRKSDMDIAKINEQISQVETEEMKHSLTNQLYNEYDVYNVRKELLYVATESKNAAELNLQIADEKFKSGAINSFNYRDIQLNYLNSALNQLQSIYNLIYSNTTLTRITGGFLEEANP